MVPRETSVTMHQRSRYGTTRDFRNNAPTECSIHWFQSVLTLEVGESANSGLSINICDIYENAYFEGCLKTSIFSNIGCYDWV
jgi:hypothetical protein